MSETEILHDNVKYIRDKVDQIDTRVQSLERDKAKTRGVTAAVLVMASVLGSALTMAASFFTGAR